MNTHSNPEVFDPNAPVSSATRKHSSQKLTVVIDGQTFRVKQSLTVSYKGNADAPKHEVLSYSGDEDSFKINGTDVGVPPGHEPSEEELAERKAAKEGKKTVAGSDTKVVKGQQGTAASKQAAVASGASTPTVPGGHPDHTLPTPPPTAGNELPTPPPTPGNELPGGVPPKPDQSLPPHPTPKK